MKNLLFLAIAALTFASCGQTATEAEVSKKDSVAVAVDTTAVVATVDSVAASLPTTTETKSVNTTATTTDAKTTTKVK
jgi:uncharacterized protein YcfL